MVFKLDKAGYDDVGMYEIGWSLGYMELPLLTTSCTNLLQVMYQPVFKGDLISSPQTLSCFDRDKWSLNIPTYTDLEEKKASYVIDLGRA
jgi:hypothetical protein